MADKLSDYLKTAAAADLIGVSQNTLRAWAKRGRTPVWVNPINGYRLFRWKDLEWLLDAVAESVGEGVCSTRGTMKPRRRIAR